MLREGAIIIVRDDRTGNCSFGETNKGAIKGLDTAVQDA